VNRFIASTIIAVGCLATVFSAPGLQARAEQQDAGTVKKQPVNDDKHLVYADFEKTDDNKKPVSTRGGAIGLYPFQAPGSKEATAKGPELVRLKADDPNHLLKFDFALFAPTEWTGVTLEIHGQADVNGDMVPDDVSGYKALSLDCYATGVPILRVEILSTGRGKEPVTVPARYDFKVIEKGLNTYKIPLKAFTQPEWVQDQRVDPKGVLKDLTSIHIIPFCENNCQTNRQGMVVVDNIVFEK
jgi:hypothetical protein